MKKIIAFFALILLLFNIVGCGLTGANTDNVGGNNSNQAGGGADTDTETGDGENNNGSSDTDLVPGGNNTGNPEAVYYAYINIYSHEDMIYAWEKLTEKDAEKGKQRQYYTFISNDDFKVVHTFYAYNAWIVPTEDIDEYFARIEESGMKPGVESTMYYIGGGDCNCSNTDLHDVKSNEYMKSPHITISRCPGGEVLDIDDISLITVDLSVRVAGGYQYECSYNGVEAFSIKCCRSLTDEELQSVFGRIIVMRSTDGK